MPGLDRHVRIAARAPPLARPGRVPGRERLGRDPDCEAAPLLQRPVVLRPVADLVARPRDLVTAWLMDLVGHRSSGERGDGPIRSTVALPKPEAVILHQRPYRRPSGLASRPNSGGATSATITRRSIWPR